MLHPILQLFFEAFGSILATAFLGAMTLAYFDRKYTSPLFAFWLVAKGAFILCAFLIVVISILVLA